MVNWSADIFILPRVLVCQDSFLLYYRLRIYPSYIVPPRRKQIFWLLHNVKPRTQPRTNSCSSWTDEEHKTWLSAYSVHHSASVYVEPTVCATYSQASFQFSEVQCAAQNLCMHHEQWFSRSNCCEFIIEFYFHHFFQSEADRFGQLWLSFADREASYGRNSANKTMGNVSPHVLSYFTGFLPPAGYLDSTKTALSMPLTSYYINHMCNWLWNACGGCENLKWAVIDP